MNAMLLFPILLSTLFSAAAMDVEDKANCPDNKSAPQYGFQQAEAGCHNQVVASLAAVRTLVEDSSSGVGQHHYQR